MHSTEIGEFEYYRRIFNQCINVYNAFLARLEIVLTGPSLQNLAYPAQEFVESGSVDSLPLDWNANETLVNICDILEKSRLPIMSDKLINRRTYGLFAIYPSYTL